MNNQKTQTSYKSKNKRCFVLYNCEMILDLSTKFFLAIFTRKICTFLK